MLTIVRECNYPQLDSVGKSEQFQTDLAEFDAIRKFEAVKRASIFGRRFFRIGKVTFYRNGFTVGEAK